MIEIKIMICYIESHKKSLKIFDKYKNERILMQLKKKLINF
jgi:hypothetical protein